MSLPATKPVQIDLQKTLDPMIEKGKEAFQEVKTKIGQLNVKVSKLAHEHLPSHYAELAMKLFKGLPFAGLLLLAPTPLALGSVALCGAVTIMQPDLLDNSIGAPLYDGVGTHSALMAVVHMVKMATSEFWVLNFALTGLHLAIAAVSYVHARQLDPKTPSQKVSEKLSKAKEEVKENTPQEASKKVKDHVQDKVGKFKKLFKKKEETLATAE